MTDLHENIPDPAGEPGGPLDPDPTAESDRGHPVRLGVLAGLVVLLGLLGGWPVLVVVLGVVVMIFLHELGHYMAARWSGMKVTEFFIGFGPKIWSFRRGETEYGVKAIPAGAYVRIVGMNNLDEPDPDDDHRTYRSKSYPKRMLVAVAGSGMHFAQALVMLFVLFAVVGVPDDSSTELTSWEVDEVSEDSAAEAVGISVGDEIVAIDGEEVTSFETLAADIAAMPGERVVLTVVRAGESFDLPVSIGVRGGEDGEPERGFLGVGPGEVTSTVGPLEAAGNAFTEFGDQTVLILGFLGDFFTPSGLGDFAGDVAQGRDDSVVRGPEGGGAGVEPSESPDEGRILSLIGAVRLGADLTEDGLLWFLVFFIHINITVGLINLLPVPPLDGGHVAVATYERIREIRRPRGERYHIDYTRLIPVVYTVILLLGMLFVSTVFLDLVDPV